MNNLIFQRQQPEVVLILCLYPTELEYIDIGSFGLESG